MKSSFTSPLSRVALATTLLLAIIPAAVSAAPVKVKLGTLAPRGVSYHKSLLAMGDAWRKSSDGQVELTVYPGGVAGGEAEMVGLMQTDSLQAAMLTAVGLSEIEPDVVGLQSIPMAFRNFDEVDYVGRKLQPALEQSLKHKGFVVLCWTDAGWVRFFSKKVVVHPDDLRRLMLFSWAGETAQVKVLQSAGFKTFPTETANIVPGLYKGTIEAVASPPFFALASQMDLPAPYMLDLNWAPLVGAVVMRLETWQKIPTAMRAAMLETAARAGLEMKAAGRRESEISVIAMEKRGLKVTRITPEIEEEWRRAVEKVYPMIRGSVVPAGIFDEAMRSIAEYRAEPKASLLSAP